MTPKHHERIKNLLAALDDYMFQASFESNDTQTSEYNAILTLERRLKTRLEEKIDDE